MKFILPILLSFLFSNIVNGQSLAFQQYTTEDGLPSSSLYDIVQDQAGFIWISTEGGLCRFDGHQFQKTPIKEVAGEDILNLFVDSKNKLWLIDLAAKISYYDKGKLYRKDQLNTSNNYQYVDIFEDKNGNHWFATKDGLIVQFDQDIFPNRSPITYGSRHLDGSKVFITTQDSSMMVLSNSSLNTFEKYKWNHQAFEEDRTIPEMKLSLNSGDSIIVSDDDRLYTYDIATHNIKPCLTKFNEHFDAGINHLYEDNNQNLWISTRDGILYIKQDTNGELQFSKYLEGTIVGKTMQDHEGNYWFTTEGDGLFFLPSIKIKTYTYRKRSNKVSVVTSNKKDQIIIGYNNNYVNILDKDFQLIKRRKLDRSNQEIYDIVTDSIGNVYFFASANLFKWDSAFHLVDNDLRGEFKSCAVGPDGKLWFGTSSSAGFIDGDEVVKLFPKRTYTVLPTGIDQAWFGSFDGLYFYKNDQSERVLDSTLHQDIRDIKMGKDSSLWIATKGNGLLVYKDSIIKHFTTDNGLVSDNCKKVFLDDQYAWLATNKGINRISLSDFNIASINDDEGLPSNEVNYIYRLQDTMLVATNNGLAIFKDDMDLYLEAPLLYISGIKIQEKDTTLQEDYKLSYAQNNIKIDFIGLAFKHAEDIQYRYKMDGVDNSWINTNVNVAQYPSLPYGNNYQFVVQAKTANSEWSAPKSIAFKIKRPFWNTWWFLALTIIMAGFIVYKFFEFIINDIKYRNEVKEKLKESQLTALRAQMNPHFLFNSLNSIQEFIIKEDKRSANRYLSQFSRLMRNILNVSDKDEIVLKKEIESLRLYLSLEALRFEKQFRYHFDIDETIDTNTIFIPTMLVQPYVENAIKHGLLHKKGEKSIHIRFRLEDKFLVCEVEDNGVGREKSREIQRNNAKLYKSKAMSLTQERLHLLNAKQNNNLNVELIDLKNEDGIASGTKVIIYISLKQKTFEQAEDIVLPKTIELKHNKTSK